MTANNRFTNWSLLGHQAVVLKFYVKKTNAFIITLAGKKFPSPSTLSYHMDSHSIEPRYACPDCGEKFRHQRKLRYHMKVKKTMPLFYVEMLFLCTQKISAGQLSMLILNDDNLDWSKTTCIRYTWKNLNHTCTLIPYSQIVMPHWNVLGLLINRSYMVTQSTVKQADLQMKLHIRDVNWKINDSNM